MLNRTNRTENLVENMFMVYRMLKIVMTGKGIGKNGR